MDNNSEKAAQQDEKDKMERIRNLLIGKNYDQLDQRLNDLDEKHQDAISGLKSEWQDKQENFQKQSAENIKSLSEKLDRISDHHKKSIDEIKNDIGALNKTLDGFFNEKEKEIAELRQQLQSLKEELEKKAEEKAGDIKSVLLKEINDLKKEKLNRSYIASLLSEAAFQIGTEAEDDK